MTLSNRAPRDVSAAILAQIAPNAARLEAATNSNLGRALIVAVSVHLLALGVFWAVSYATFSPPPPVEVPWREIFIAPPTSPAPAPRLSETPPGGGTPARAAGAGIVTPVPETQARPDATTATQSEMAVSTAGPLGPAASGGDGATRGAGTAPPKVPEQPTAGLVAPPIPADPAPGVSEAPSVLELSEISPELVGGLAAFQAGIVYPRFDRDAGVSGRVIVRFVVAADGTPGSIEVARSVSPGLDRAAIDAVRRARFTPGVQNGRAVAVQMTLPVTFEIR